MTSVSDSSPKALSHIRVLDLTRVLAGPWATQNFCDMGADVIKVERPGAGDDTRGWGPPFVRDGAGRETSDASYFISANRGKKSITIDITVAEGQALVRELARRSDVFVENHKVGAMAKYGLSYEDLRAVNPRLIYCSITGFGQSGPYADQPGYDFIFQGMCGLMSLTGFPETPDGEDGPVKVGIAIGDIFGGMYAAVAILAALERRNVSGTGQYIDLALLDSMVSLMSYQAQNYFLSGRIPRALGNSQPNLVPYQVFRCKQDKIILAIGNDGQFASFCKIAGRPELAADPRYSRVGERRRNRDSLVIEIKRVMLERTTREWLDLLNPANVPCGPIYDMKQVFEDPQVAHRGLYGVLPHSAGGLAPNIGNPIQFSETPIRYAHAAPLLGEHTRPILSDLLGLAPEAIEALRRKGVVG